MAATTRLERVAERRGGSSPSARTISELKPLGPIEGKIKLEAAIRDLLQVAVFHGLSKREAALCALIVANECLLDAEIQELSTKGKGSSARE